MNARLILLHLARYQWVVIWIMIGGGFGFAALERSRPELIHPYQQFLYNALSAYINPVRAIAGEARKMTRRGGELWSAQTGRETLQTELARMESELQSTREELRRLGRVSGLRHWRSSVELEFLPADVIGFSTEDQNALLTINRGSRDHLTPGLPVVGQKGLAGIIREVSERTSLVQALTDPLSAVGVADVQTRHRGVIFGRGRTADPEFIPENEVQPINPGSTLITSGFGNSIYPKGLVIGTVMEKRTNERGLVYGVIEPAEKFDALEEVLVIRPSDRAPDSADDSMGAFTLEMTTRTLALSPAPAPAEMTDENTVVPPIDPDFAKAAQQFSEDFVQRMTLMDLRPTTPGIQGVTP